MKSKKLLLTLLVFIVALLIMGGVLLLASTHHHTDFASERPSEEMADLVVVNKGMHSLTLFHHGQILRTYTVSLGKESGQKVQEGDHKTPEGKYKIVAKNPNSAFHFSLLLSYPNEADKKRAKELGVEPGRDIEIHGIQNGLGWVGAAQASLDWTDGCVAVTDDEIEEINSFVKVGTTVVIFPE